ncbi:MAG TPA: sugar phosphate isomerase/epimerase family protein [Caulifigura sp.]|jgi:sugar phosphate isomerase/epimerase|nr:sugar phosphate isomerase/epimerase family protein [Caulifigura sp.]
MSKWPIGVFTSIDAGLGVNFDVVKELKIPTIQVHAPHSARNPQVAKEFLAKTNAAGVQVTCVFGGFDGESYASIPITAQTVGLVPESTRAARVKEMKEISDFAKLLNVEAVGLHIGFVPADRNSAAYKSLLECARDLLDYAAKNGQRVHLETGQETADHLLEFFHDVDRKNLAINFDPANMILYGNGNPIEALMKVGEFVKSVHCKDAKWAAEGVRGKEWGTEVPLGDGDVNIELYLRVLKSFGYEGPLTIEREIAHDRAKQKADIGHAVNLLETLKKRIG